MDLYFAPPREVLAALTEAREHALRLRLQEMERARLRLQRLATLAEELAAWRAEALVAAASGGAGRHWFEIVGAARARLEHLIEAGQTALAEAEQATRGARRDANVADHLAETVARQRQRARARAEERRIAELVATRAGL